MGNLVDLKARVTSGELCISPKCMTCAKKKIERVVRRDAVQVPVAALMAASPLTVRMAALNVPDPNNAEAEIEVLAFFHCQDYPCLLAQFHDIVIGGYLQDLTRDVEVSDRHQAAASKWPKPEKRKVLRQKRKGK